MNYQGLVNVRREGYARFFKIFAVLQLQIPRQIHQLIRICT